MRASAATPHRRHELHLEAEFQPCRPDASAKGVTTAAVPHGLVTEPRLGAVYGTGTMKIALALASILLATSTASFAAELSDMRRGTFSGIWCGYQAEFRVTSQDSGTWIFRGTVFFPEYDQADELFIEQYSDQSLRMTRTLGANTGAEGRKQMAQTHPPQLNSGGNGDYALYESESTGGIDCENRRTRITVPRG